MCVQTFIQTYIQTLQRSPGFRIRPGRVARGTAAAERFPLPEGAGRGSLPAQGRRGLKALGRGSGKGHPGGGVQRGEGTPLVRVVGGKAPCLNRVKYSVPTEWMRWLSQYFALLSYGNFSNLLFRTSDGTAPITPVHHRLFSPFVSAGEYDSSIGSNKMGYNLFFLLLIAHFIQNSLLTL